MVRRTRKEIIKYYKKDLEEQKLTFPKLNTPKKIVYKFDDKLDKVFNETLEVIKILTYSRYKALTYLKQVKKEYKSLLVGQQNLSGFMKSILLKRMENNIIQKL